MARAASCIFSWDNFCHCCTVWPHWRMVSSGIRGFFMASRRVFSPWRLNSARRSAFCSCSSWLWVRRADCLRAGQVRGGLFDIARVGDDFFLEPGDVLDLGHECLEVLAQHFGVGFRAENADEIRGGAGALAFGKEIAGEALQFHGGISRDMIVRGTPEKSVLRLFLLGGGHFGLDLGGGDIVWSAPSETTSQAKPRSRTPKSSWASARMRTTSVARMAVARGRSGRSGWGGWSVSRWTARRQGEALVRPNWSRQLKTNSPASAASEGSLEKVGPCTCERCRVLSAVLHGGRGQRAADRADETDLAAFKRAKRAALHRLGLVGIAQIIGQMDGGGELLQGRPVAGQDVDLRQGVADFNLQNAVLHLSGNLQADLAGLNVGLASGLPAKPAENAGGFPEGAIVDCAGNREGLAVGDDQFLLEGRPGRQGCSDPRRRLVRGSARRRSNWLEAGRRGGEQTALPEAERLSSRAFWRGGR